MSKNLLPSRPEEARIARAVQASLRVEDLQKLYRDKHASSSCDAFTGHCFVATNAFWHLMGGRDGPYKPLHVGVLGDSHWFLVDKRDGSVVDLTASQFSVPVPYKQGIGMGMQGPQRDTLPTARAAKVIDRARLLLGHGRSGGKTRRIIEIHLYPRLAGHRIVALMPDEEVLLGVEDTVLEEGPAFMRAVNVGSIFERAVGAGAVARVVPHSRAPEWDSDLAGADVGMARGQTWKRRARRCGFCC